MIHKRLATYSLYFGDNSDAYKPFSYHIPDKRAHYVKSRLNADYLYFINQTHSVDGVTLSHNTFLKDTPLQSFNATGDFIITNIPKIAIGVLTADCLPLLIYDPENHVCAAVHAGWLGTVSGIVPTVLKSLKNQFNTNLSEIMVWFGPSAGVCCYEVDASFVQSLRSAFNDVELIEKTVQYRHEKIFFDVPKFNQLLLERAGVLANHIFHEYNHCTIENQMYASYRRDGKNGNRQMTVIALH